MCVGGGGQLGVVVPLYLVCRVLQLSVDASCAFQRESEQLLLSKPVAVSSDEDLLGHLFGTAGLWHALQPMPLTVPVRGAVSWVGSGQSGKLCFVVCAQGREGGGQTFARSPCGLAPACAPYATEWSRRQVTVI